MKVCICGSRDFRDLTLVHDYIAKLPAGTIIISGGARGVDQAAEAAAKALGFDSEVFPAHWDTEGKAAGFRRNTRMVIACDRVVAFWDGTSRGTKHTIEQAAFFQKPVEIIR